MKRLPNHVAIVMDGCLQWGQRGGQDARASLLAGARATYETITAAQDLGLRRLGLALGVASALPQHLVALPLACGLQALGQRWRNALMGAYFLPYITSTVAIAILFSFLAALYPAVAAGHIPAEASALLTAAVQRVLAIYRDACASSR